MNTISPSNRPNDQSPYMQQQSAEFRMRYAQQHGLDVKDILASSATPELPNKPDTLAMQGVNLKTSGKLLHPIGKESDKSSSRILKKAYGGSGTLTQNKKARKMIESGAT